MIMLDFKTKSGSRYLVDVVGQRLKKIESQHKPQQDAQWWPYHEIVGAKVGECWLINWGDGHSSQTTEVTSYSFTK